MHVTPIQTHKITQEDTSITKILDKYITHFEEKMVLGVSSKIVSICEGRYVPLSETTKEKLVEQEADLYLPGDMNPWGVSFAIIHNTLAASAGVDESNAFGNYILLPENPQASANAIRDYLVTRFNITHAGVVLIDGHSMPLRWGVMGQSIAHSGFKALKWVAGTNDLFGRELHVSNQSVVEGLAASASLVMGEAAEQTPLSIISDIPFVEFQDRNPTKEELEKVKISHEEDMYWPLIKNAPWKKGKKAQDEH